MFVQAAQHEARQAALSAAPTGIGRTEAGAPDGIRDRTASPSGGEGGASAAALGAEVRRMEDRIDVYIYIFIYLDLDLHTHTHTHIYVYMFIYLYLYSYLYLYIYIYMYIYICIYTYTCIHIDR